VALIEFTLAPERGARHLCLAKLESAVGPDGDVMIFARHGVTNWLDLGFEDVLDEKRPVIQSVLLMIWPLGL